MTCITWPGNCGFLLAMVLFEAQFLSGTGFLVCDFFGKEQGWCRTCIMACFDLKRCIRVEFTKMFLPIFCSSKLRVYEIHATLRDNALTPLPSWSAIMSRWPVSFKNNIHDATEEFWQTNTCDAFKNFSNGAGFCWSKVLCWYYAA